MTWQVVHIMMEKKTKKIGKKIEEEEQKSTVVKEICVYLTCHNSSFVLDILRLSYERWKK